MNLLLFLNTNPYYNQGASANRFRGLIEGLRVLGHTVDVAVVGGIIQPDEERSCGEGVIYLSKANNYSYWWARANKYLLGGINNYIVSHRFKKLDTSKYDILWLANGSQVLSLYQKHKKRIGCKTFMELNEYNDIYLTNNLNKLQYWDAMKANRRFINVVRCVDCFGVMTNKLIEHYKSLAKSDAQFLHLPMTVDLSRFENSKAVPNEFGSYIAFTGCMDKNKDGVDVLVKAFAKIAEKYSTINLILAGFYSYDTPEIMSLVSQYKLTERVKYIGPLKRDDIPPFVCNAKALVLSRPDSHQAQGGFPTKLGEYLATGNPVCVTKVSEIPEYLEDNESAFMATPGDVDSFADAMDRILSDPENAKRVGLNGRKVAEENFDAKLQAKRLADFLEQNLQK